MASTYDDLESHYKAAEACIDREEPDLLELNDTLKAILEVLDGQHGKLPSALVVNGWYRLVAPLGFFKDIIAPNAEQTAAVTLLQSLTALISVAVLRVDAVDILDKAYQSEDPLEQLRVLEGTYLYDTACIDDLQNIFLSSIQYGPSPAAPALLLWATMGIKLRQLGEIARVDRESTIEYPGDDDGRDRRVSFSSEPVSTIEQVHLIILQSDQQQTTDGYKALVTGAIDSCQAHEAVATLSEAIEVVFRSGDGLQIASRILLLKLLDETAILTEYCASLIEATVIVAGGKQRSWTCTRSKPQYAFSNIFALPEQLGSQLMSEALNRAPFELVPLLRLARASCLVFQANGDGRLSITDFLSTNRSLTQILPPHFTAYDLPREDEEPSLVRLLEDLPLFRSRRKITSMGHSQALVTAVTEAAMFIPRGTTGTVLRDGRPLVVLWRHKYSTWQYLTNWLSTVVAGSDWYSTADGASVGFEEANEVLSFLATWLHTSLSLSREAGNSRAANQEVEQFLAALRDGFRPERDIVNVALDVFEQQLQNHPQRPDVDGSLELLTNATLFLSGIVETSPGRVWAHLARSQLLTGALVAVEEATEMVTGRYDFLIACIRLYEALIEDAVRNTVARKATSKIRRFDEQPTVDAVQDRTISTVLLAFTRTLTGLLASSAEWRFASPFEDKSEIYISLTRIFGSIFKYTYGYDDVSPQKNTAVLNESARHLVDVFLGASGSDMTSQPLLGVIDDASIASLDQLACTVREALVAQVEGALGLFQTLLQLSTYLQLPRPAIENALFTAAPVLARLYTRCTNVRGRIASLLEALVRSASRAENEPPSLLGALGEEQAKAFLSSLLADATAAKDRATRVAVWQLFSAIVSCKQQSLASYLLSGALPKDGLAIKAGKQEADAKASVLSTALDVAAKPAELDIKLATAVLRFILLSQNFYPRVMRAIKKHASFLDGILAYLGNLKRNPRERDAKQLIRSCHETRVAGTIGQILAMCIHHSKQLGDFDIADKAVTRLAYFREFGVAPPKYNASLHNNLEKNVESKYPSLRGLDTFRKTGLLDAHFGEDFSYDLEFATVLLNFDPHWTHEHSLRRELPLANVDLSLVEAQIELLHSWKLLATELSTVCDQVPRVQSLLVNVVQKCLEANSSNENPPVVFERLVQTRADFAFTILQRLLNSSLTPTELQPILGLVWDSIRASGADLEAPFHGALPDYYRSLLRILYFALKPHAAKPSPTKCSSQNTGAVQPPAGALTKTTSTTTSTVLEILERVVCLGFRSLASRLHESPAEGDPSDFILITALLQSVLSIQGIDALYEQLVMIFTSTGVVRYATSLFSWAEQLTVTIDGQEDPIYGELSVLFLLELSTVQLMAETMAVEGILAQLSAAHICQYFTQGRGMGPFDQPSRLYLVWSKGLLPLCINLLGAVGAPIAAEVAAFLNQFAPQMARNVSDLASRPNSKLSRLAGPVPPEPVTLAVALETHNLALISYALDQAREAGALEGVVSSDIPALDWDRAAVKEELQVWLNGSRGLDKRVILELEGASMCLGENGAA